MPRLEISTRLRHIILHELLTELSIGNVGQHILQRLSHQSLSLRAHVGKPPGQTPTAFILFVPSQQHIELTCRLTVRQ